MKGFLGVGVMTGGKAGRPVVKNGRSVGPRENGGHRGVEGGNSGGRGVVRKGLLSV